MSETFTKSPEQTPLKELPQPDPVPRSKELFAGDINGAVIAVQNAMGFPIDSEWWSKNVGEANNDAETAERFDKAYKKAYEAEFWRENGVAEEQITSVQSHTDYETESDDPDRAPTQINGINIPEQVAQNNEIDPAAWAAEEQARRLNYVFTEAEFHLNHEFTIGSETYIVDSISYTGTNGDYETLEIKIMNTETGEVSDYMQPDYVNQLISRGESQSNETVEERKQDALDAFNERFADDEDAPSVAEFEAWLDNHPELQDLNDSPEQEGGTAQPPQSTPQSAVPDDQAAFNTTFEAVTNPNNWQDTAPDAADAKDEVDTALEAFDQLVADAPEYQAYKDDYLDSLYAKIAGKYSPEIAEQLIRVRIETPSE